MNTRHSNNSSSINNSSNSSQDARSIFEEIYRRPSEDKFLHFGKKVVLPKIIEDPFIQ